MGKRSAGHSPLPLLVSGPLHWLLAEHQPGGGLCALTSSLTCPSPPPPGLPIVLENLRKSSLLQPTGSQAPPVSCSVTWTLQGWAVQGDQSRCHQEGAGPGAAEARPARQPVKQLSEMCTFLQEHAYTHAHTHGHAVHTSVQISGAPPLRPGGTLSSSLKSPDSALRSLSGTCNGCWGAGEGHLCITMHKPHLQAPRTLGERGGE